jgi:hypothetical protein
LSERITSCSGNINMHRSTALLVVLSLLPVSAALQSVAAKTIQPVQDAAAVLTNADVLTMVKSGLADDVIVARLKHSKCTCDASVGELQRLKAEGVTDAVLVALIIASKASSAEPDSAEPPFLTIPAGTIIDVETAYRFSSQEIRKGEAVSFRVVNPVKVGDVVVIEIGATATGRVVLSERGGHFGRAGRIAWEMETVTAIDGTQIPIRASSRVVGDSKGASVATRMAVTGALLGPLAPLALLYGFKRGENAYIPQGRRYVVSVSAETAVKTSTGRL